MTFNDMLEDVEGRGLAVAVIGLRTTEPWTRVFGGMEQGESNGPAPAPVKKEKRGTLVKGDFCVGKGAVHR
jgi:hypothetical protein